MMDAVERTVRDAVQRLSLDLRQLNINIHDHPETGGNECRAHDFLTDYMERHGFQVIRHAAGMATAFIAEYDSGRPGPRVGYFSEYDALPGVGHGCGHNLIAISGIGCAVATKVLMEQALLAGKVVLFGTPAEESWGGKLVFVEQNEIQNRIDFAMMLHPYGSDINYCQMLALDQLDVEFFGKASHAGMAPWQGVNALDALMQGWNNMSMLRQQTLPTNRLHGIFLEGGKSANVIPDYATGRFLARSLKHAELAELKPKLENCFKGAAMATGCDVKLKWGPRGALADVFMNDTLTDTYRRYMEEEGAVFAPREEEEKIKTGSSDFGNVSHVVPSTHPHFGIGFAVPSHTTEFAEAVSTEKAHMLTLRAIRSLVMAAADVILDKKLYNQMIADFQRGKK